MTDLLSVSDAQELILKDFYPVDKTIVGLFELQGRVLAEDVYSEIELPPFTNSSMDGYAVLASDIEKATSEYPVSLKVIADIPAGVHPNFILKPGTSARVMTGAPIPQGADAVVPVEFTNNYPIHTSSAMPDSIQIFRSVNTGDFLRPKGQDVQKGQCILKKGRKLAPHDIGLLAALGFSSAAVFRKPRVALLSTGDELVHPGKPLKPGQIRDTNTYTLTLLAEKYGCVVKRLETTKDNLKDIRAQLDYAALEGVDFIISSAGVSVGAFDFVKQIIQDEGKLGFWRVNMRPGKPVAFGKYKNIPFLGLPGNPVSSYIGFLVFAVPAIQKLSGLTKTKRQIVKVKLEETVESDGRESYLRAIIEERDGDRFAKLTGHQGSGNLYSLSLSNALLIVPSGVKSLPTGMEADAWIISD